MRTFVRIRRWLAWRPFGARVRREEGVALMAIVVVLAVMTASTADFAYNAKVDYTSAINARDELRAHYLARSSINLSQLLLRVQSRFIDPMREHLGGMDLQVADYAPLLMQAFNNKEGAEMLGGMLGIETAGIKGLGVELGSFDLEMESLDGKLNVNCGGGANTGAPAVVRVAASLAAMMMPARYNRLFEEPDEKGQYADRMELLRAIIDWADQDMVLFGSTAAEDYRYNAGKDPYEIKNQYFDSLEELRLVKGVDDDFMAAFGEELTVYGECRINVALAGPKLLTAAIIQFAASPNDPALQYQNLALLVRYLTQIRDLMGGFRDAKTFIQAVENPMGQLSMASALDSLTGGNRTKPSGLPQVLGVKLKPEIGEAIAAGGPRRIWRIEGSAEVGRVKKKISAVWDTKHISMQAGRHNMGPGGYLYWREE
ncbi:MAG: general secretion pathway protein GspK [Deltaproteobacteria bacterium]|nr:general secretion pathway protein GspK [Deltaproteobacteria bacterium]